ncbi:MAG TPA: hypothetical protein IAB56_00570 [Candidatus Scybalousia intestinigallinarum]|nr:hypothetical protein [Candidatus Scybalousia intestinigallinarum]
MFDKEKMWRFPGNNYLQEQGIDTPDMETFAQDPIASLARESCQNSIDARIAGETARIEFKTFDILRNEIPGVDRIEKEINSCLDYRKNNSKLYQTLSNMKNNLNNSIIHCIRVSDFNTVGLKGINDLEDSPFYLLTRGTGISDKNGSKGGSKGIGKFASFVASSFNTVFYSTLNMDGEKGYIGICKLCSTRMEGTDEKTQGTGYFGLDNKNMPILEDFNLDKSYKRETTGTDIYILGFRKNNNWKKELITKILDSFMCAIYYEDLEIVVDDLTINKNNLGELIENDDYILKRSYNNIKSQYILLTDSDVFKNTLEIEDYGKVDILLKGFSKDESDLATNECVMIRYPYMKIKTLPRISNVPCSAMCIIGDNTLNSLLRDIENPQHTNWEINRIDDDDLKSELRHILKTLNDSIINYVYDKLSTSRIKETDVEGASEYLPGIDDSNIGTGEADVIIEKPKIVKKVKNKVKDKIGIKPDDEGNSLLPGLGDHKEDGEGSPIPNGSNNSSGGDTHDSNNETGYTNEDSDKEIMTLAQLSGMQYRLFVPDKKSGKLIISFESLYTENNCELELKYLDDSNTRYNINISGCRVNGIPLDIVDSKLKNIKIEEGKKYRIELDTDLRELYTFEVKMYANR